MYFKEIIFPLVIAVTSCNIPYRSKGVYHVGTASSSISFSLNIYFAARNEIHENCTLHPLVHEMLKSAEWRDFLRLTFEAGH